LILQLLDFQLPHWDQLWRDGFIKQVTGFSILGLVVLGLLISPRKRLSKLHQTGQFHWWRMLHLGTGVLTVFVLLAHTGARLGSGLNFALMLSFCLLILAGALATGILAYQHKLPAALAQRAHKQMVFLHIILFWPLPVLLGFHILKGYWY